MKVNDRREHSGPMTSALSRGNRCHCAALLVNDRRESFGSSLNPIGSSTTSFFIHLFATRTRLRLESEGETRRVMLATCSNILQLWNNEDYSLISDFGHDHLPSTDTIKTLDWKKDNCNSFILFLSERSLSLSLLANYLVFTYKQTGRVQLYDIQKNKSVELSTVVKDEDLSRQ